MKKFIVGTFISFISLNSFSMSLVKSDSKDVVDGPSANFTGKVKVLRMITAEAPARTSTALVIFSAGARSAWHSHPLGQTLIVSKGQGRIQEWGGKVQTISLGDVIFTPPGVKHWHGANPDSEMSHYAIVETKDGKQVDWMEKVTEEQYKKIEGSL